MYNKQYENPYMKEHITNLKPIGEKLKDERFLRRMSLAQMGQLMGVSGIQIMYYEEKDRHIRYDILKKYAEKREKSINEFFLYSKIVEYRKTENIGE